MASNRVDSWFWRHAYMLEFRETDDSGVSLNTESFTFSLPPESEQITLGQRVNYTKTFGGVVVDDYGNDVFKINLSGTTGNSDLKTIFRGFTKFPKSLSGEQEILYLAKLIEVYGNIDKLKNKSVYLYDLSKVTLESILSTPNYWQVNIDNFKYQRDKANPTFYKYTLEMTGYRPKSQYWFKSQENFDWVISANMKTLNVINEVFATVAAIVDACTLTIEELESFQEIYENYKNLVIGKIDQASNTWHEVVKLGNWVKAKSKSSSTDSDADEDETEDSEEEGTIVDNNDSNIDLSNSASDLKTSVDDLISYIYSELNNMSDEIIETILNQQGLSSRDEFESLVSAMLNELKFNVEKISADVKSLTKVAYYKGTVYYGKKKVKVNATDTYESISLKEYGTVDNADEIAIFNNGTELSVGAEIVLPILTQQESITGNEVIKPFDDLDEYGKDLKLDDDGDISINYSNGDLKTVESTDNIQQSIVSRISTEMGTRIRDTVYGIKSSIGGSNSITAFLYASIHETVLSDPRIEDIDSIEFYGSGDRLYYIVNYTTKIGDKEQVRGNV